jgi:Spy/CpxP family protein refolding chaperone
MKRQFALSVAGGVLAVALLSGAAYAHGFGGGHHDLIPPIVGHLVSHDQMRAIFEADKSNLKTLHSAARSAHEQLENDLIAGKDTTADLQAVQTAQNNLMAEKVKLAQEILATLTPQQRTQVSSFMTQWRALKQQQWQLFQQYGGAPQAPPGGGE